MGQEKIEAKRAAQREYCRDMHYPHFAPSDGKCRYCGKQIYERISLKTAGSQLITGCPWCNRSYCG